MTIYIMCFPLFKLPLFYLTHTHTAGKTSGWVPVIQQMGSAISHHSNMPSFPLSLFLSLSLFSPIRSAKRRKMADKILPQRVRSITISFICLSPFVLTCVYFMYDCMVHVIVLEGRGQKVKVGSYVFLVVKGVDSQGMYCRVVA